MLFDSITKVFAASCIKPVKLFRKKNINGGHKEKIAIKRNRASV
jgi:hypothetical protein